MGMPKITMADVEKAIKMVSYVLLPSGRTTVCEIILYNGFTAVGVANVTFIENFDAEMGKQAAYNKAVADVFELLSFQLRESHFAANMHDPEFKPLR